MYLNGGACVRLKSGKINAPASENSRGAEWPAWEAQEQSCLLYVQVRLSLAETFIDRARPLARRLACKACESQYTLYTIQQFNIYRTLNRGQSSQSSPLPPVHLPQARFCLKQRPRCLQHNRRFLEYRYPQQLATEAMKGLRMDELSAEVEVLES